MKERREGSTRVIEYRDGYEIRSLQDRSVWWRKLGERLRPATSLTSAMRAIDKIAGPYQRPAAKPLPKDPNEPKFVNARPWIEWGGKKGRL